MSKNTMDGDDDDAIPDRVWVQLYIEDEKEGDVVQVMTKEPDATFRSMIEIKSIAQAVQKAHAVLDPLPDSLIVLDMYAFHDAKTKLSKIDEWNPKVHGGDVENRPMTAKLEAGKEKKQDPVGRVCSLDVSQVLSLSLSSLAVEFSST
jgi:hypothetical protein